MWPFVGLLLLRWQKLHGELNTLSPAQPSPRPSGQICGALACCCPLTAAGPHTCCVHFCNTPLLHPAPSATSPSLETHRSAAASGFTRLSPGCSHTWYSSGMLVSAGSGRSKGWRSLRSGWARFPHVIIKLKVARSWHLFSCFTMSWSCSLPLACSFTPVCLLESSHHLPVREEGREGVFQHLTLLPRKQISLQCFASFCSCVLVIQHL